jgi:hypothetical protein
MNAGMAWYTPEAWRELQAIPEAAIEMNYAQFVRKCERLIAEFAAQGYRVVKLPIDIGQMTEWCHRHGYEIDDKGRAAFGAVLTCAHDQGLDVMAVDFEDATRVVQ